MALGIEADVGLAVRIDDTLSEMQRLVQALTRSERRTPRYLSLPFTLAVPATSGVLNYVDVGGPNQGRRWFVNRVSCAVAIGISQSTGAGAIYVMSGPGSQQGTLQTYTPPSGGGFAPLNLEWAAAGSMPFAESWGRDQFCIPYPNHLYFAMPALLSSQTAVTYMGRFQVTDLGEQEDVLYTLNSPTGDGR